MEPEWFCEACGQQIRHDGILWVDLNRVADVEAATVQAEADMPDCFTLDDLDRWPAPERWQQHHYRCRTYPVELAYELVPPTTWRDLLKWTIHLSEKAWIHATNWNDHIRTILNQGAHA